MQSRILWEMFFDTGQRLAFSNASECLASQMLLLRCLEDAHATAVVCQMSLPGYCSATHGGLGPLLSRNLKCGAAVYPGHRFGRHTLGVQWELSEPGAESSVCTPMLVLVRLQRHFIAADCGALRSFVLTSGDCLVTTIYSQLTEARDQFESAQVNVDIEWPPPKELAGSSSRTDYNTHGPPDLHITTPPHTEAL
jgi:hypothetical protein